MKRSLQSVISLLVMCFISPAAAIHVLPIHVEERHSGSFYFLADVLDWEKSYHLLLFDHHSDAGEVFNSDYVRGVLAAHRAGDRDGLFTALKKKGAVQDSNWFEPLLPRPVKAVTWVPGPSLTAAQARRAFADVREKINGHEEAAPREAGDLSGFVRVHDFARQKTVTRFDMPVVASLDLDYFNAVTDTELATAVDDVFDYLLSVDNLEVLTIAVSTMYQPSPERAGRVLDLALRRCLNIVNARLRIEPFADNGPDLSPEAIAFYKKRKQPPRVIPDMLTAGTKDLLADSADLVMVECKSGEWRSLVTAWKKESAARPRVILRGKDVKVEPDGFTIAGKGDDVVLSLDGTLVQGAGASVRWKALVPAGSRYNIVGDGASFARGAPRHVYFRERELPALRGSASFALDDMRSLMDGVTGFGTTRIFAEVGEGPAARLTAAVRVNRMRDESFIGRLTGAFGLPYVFGAGMLRRGGSPVPDTLHAADCVSFIIRALRAQGKRVPYTNPGGLRKYLAPAKRVKCFSDGVARYDTGPVGIDDRMIRSGIILHFGVHVAALYSDEEPRGLLSENDLVVHHLEGFPEIVPLKNLDYSGRPFDLMPVK